jgi:multidrug transporter EmrE-like cation transporter
MKVRILHCELKWEIPIDMHWILFVLIGATLVALSMISLKHGLTQINAIFPQLSINLQSIYHLATNLYIWLALVGFGTGFFLWSVGLSRTELSSAYPIFIGVEYSLVMILSWLILTEAFVPLKIAGIALVLIGIIIITTL